MSDKDIDFIKNNYAFMTVEEISKCVGFDKKYIKGWIDHHDFGVTKRRDINKEYFNFINTPIKAYLLGFLFADGWVINNEKMGKYEVGMSLQSCDKYILDLLNNELGGCCYYKHITSKDKVINNVKTCSGDQDEIRIFSKDIVNDLIKNGVVPNKTNSDIHPDFDMKYFYDFLRGYIDGDGCYYLNNNNKIIIHITCCSKQVLMDLSNKLSSVGINSSIYTENERKYRLYINRYDDVYKLITRMYYNGCECLERKYKKIKYLLNGLAV